MAAPQKEGSRERVLECAAEEFARAGFAGARIDRIAARTKLNVRMIYYHFGSKRGLYRAVLERIYEEMSRILDRDPKNRVALEMYFDLLAEHPRFADILVHELLDGAKHLKVMWKERPDLFKQIHMRARELIVAGVKDGSLRAVDPPTTVLLLTSIVCFVTAARHSHALFLDGRSVDFKEQLFSLLYDGLKRR